MEIVVVKGQKEAINFCKNYTVLILKFIKWNEWECKTNYEKSIN